jgi:hypothetical protein
MKTNVVAFYLPQFHEIEANNIWWGKGFTEWTNVKKAKPILQDHYQPHIPINNNYYNLEDNSVLFSQAEIAKEYGLTGFCFYHYWFNGKKLLEKPIEKLLESNCFPIDFMLCWANENWTRRWDGKNKEILIGIDYSNYKFYEHCSYISQFFFHQNYLRINNLPVYMIYKANDIPNLPEFILKMRDNLRKLGIAEILIFACTQGLDYDNYFVKSGIDKIVDFLPNGFRLQKQADKKLDVLFQTFFGYRKYLIHKILPKFTANIILNYKKLFDLLMERPLKDNHYPCLFPSWDNTARRGLNGMIIQNKKPELFYTYLLQFIMKLKIRQINTLQEEVIFINAWNEWAEGCHLEPDEEIGWGFLEATQKAILDSETNT